MLGEVFERFAEKDPDLR